MALSAATFRRLANTQRLAVQVVNSSVMYAGAFAAIGSAQHATAANVGRVFPYNDAAGTVWAGLCQGGGGSGASQGQKSVTGTATAANMVELVMESFVVESCTVTGATAATDVGSYVYLTDDTTITLTRPSIGCPVGIVVAWKQSTTCDVMFFSVETVIAIVAGGCGKHLLCLGTHLCASQTNSDVITSFPMPHSGQITKFYAVIGTAPAGSNGTVTLNLEIGTTNVGPSTPTSIVVATGDTKGAVTASAAVSLNNKFSEGSLLSVEATSTTTMSAGTFTLYVEYLTGPGL